MESTMDFHTLGVTIYVIDDTILTDDSCITNRELHKKKVIYDVTLL